MTLVANPAGEEATKRQPLSVPAAVAQQFKEVCKSRSVGRSMNDAATRLVLWFNRQRAFVRTAVTNDVDEGMEFAYIAALRDLADALERKVTGEEASPPPEAAGPAEGEPAGSPQGGGSSSRRPDQRKPPGRTPARGR